MAVGDFDRLLLGLLCLQVWMQALKSGWLLLQVHMAAGDLMVSLGPALFCAVASGGLPAPAGTHGCGGL